MSGTFSIPGVASGMDWASMVDEIIAKSQKAYEPMVTKRDNLERKITVYEEYNQTIRTLQSTLTSLRLPSIYKAKTTEASRLDSNGLPQAVLTSTVTSDAAIMNYDIEVLNKATTMSRYGDALPNRETDKDKPADYSIGKDGVFYINSGGKRAKITVSASDTVEAIARKINNAKDMTSTTVSLDVTASVVDGKLVVRSTKTGAGSGDKLSEEVLRSLTGHDTISFYADLNNEVTNGAVAIKWTDQAGDEHVGQVGLDFDIVGNEIRWRDTDPKIVTAGSSYSIGYKPSTSDVLEYTVTRGATGENGYDAIFDSKAHEYDSTTGKIQLPGTLTFKINGVLQNYQENVDYIKSHYGVMWLSGKGPAEGAEYTVEYTPAGTETWRLSAGTRSDRDLTGTTGTTTSVSPSGVTTTTTGAAPTYADYMKGGGSATITQGAKTWKEGVDFDIVDSFGGGSISVKWRSEAAYGAPEAGSSYNLQVNYTTTSGVNTIRNTYTNTLTRQDTDNFSLSSGNTYLPLVSGSLQGIFNGKIYDDYNKLEYDQTISNTVNGVTTNYQVFDVTLNPGSTNTYVVKWTPPSAAVGAPRVTPVPDEDTYTIEYTGNMNRFSFDDNGDGSVGVLDLLGLNDYNSDEMDTDGRDAQLRINDGRVMNYSTNTIEFTEDDTVFDDDGNVVSLYGLTLTLKGPGKVQLDVTQDAEQSVTALQNYITAYNELMDWMNIKLVEKEVDDSVKATIDADDFRMRWGLLYGDRILRSVKSKLRDLSADRKQLGFQTRTGREPLYGTLGEAGFVGEGFFTVRLGGTKSTITVNVQNTDGKTIQEEANIGGFVKQVFVSEGDTLQDVADKINEALKHQYTSSVLGEPRMETVPIYGQDDKTILGYESKWVTPSQEIVMGKAEVQNGKIVLTSGFNDATNGEIPLMLENGAGTGLLETLGINDRYTMLSQVGISTGASTGVIGTNAKTGFLEFDTDKYMEALKEDPNAVADLMVTSMKEMDSYLTSLCSTSQYEFAPGVVGIQGRVASAISQLQTEIEDINTYLANADERLEAKATSLYKQFSAAEVTLARLSEQSQWLSSVVSSLNGTNS